ncbi:pyridoxamine 5'-phosphate oxidase family protein [Geothrix oryzisoli]|uniref:pyridoxamine 5'-phosphate oxidase family protein n=1 Tax=Geothrix oryzisoli TaxID=2922721 RepID=UPI001FAD6785|nr:pyridoxamine 5'-phosphate oxidase family protein [Geothrix oryzisoli]
MEIPEKMTQVLAEDGVVAIATLGEEGPHLVNTWNSYVRVMEGGRLLIPVGGMQRTEANVAFNDRVLVTLGSSKVAGRHGAGTGFLIQGRAAFITSGPDFEVLRAKFAWARATLAITPDAITQTL